MFRLFRQIRSAVSLLNPEEVRRRAARRPVIGLVASTGAGYVEMEDFLVPSALSRANRAQLMNNLYRADDSGSRRKFDLVLCEQGLACPANAFTFFRDDPQRTIDEILQERQELGLALARTFYPFRKPVVNRIVNAVARENAMFAVASSLPNIVPSLLELPWAVGEFASDTAFITINQVRMAFLIAAASGGEVGFKQQTAEIGSILAGAFGWRAIARELAGKIPFGGGLIGKGSIAFAGTYVVGKGLEHFHHVGRGYSRAERRAAYESAFERGKNVVAALLSGLKAKSAA